MLSPEVLSKRKQVISNAPYLVLSYDEIIVVNNTSWISVHCYIVQDIFQLIFILLEYVIKCGSTPTSSSTLIMGSLMEKGGLLKKQIVQKLSMSFGANGASTMHMSFITYFSFITTCKIIINSKFVLFKRLFS
jgi:GTP cyclohydrolase III